MKDIHALTIEDTDKARINDIEKDIIQSEVVTRDIVIMRSVELEVQAVKRAKIVMSKWVEDESMYTLDDLKKVIELLNEEVTYTTVKSDERIFHYGANKS